LEKAVGRAWKEAEPGDVVLLSPGCASFDQFQGFEERGERFAQMVRGLKERGRS
jgi:UDP-N-acetylmuramoylalanine--D-glutamate ligase